MKKAVVIAVLILAIAPCLEGAENLPAFPFICTAGQATVEVAPDIAAISFSIVCSDADAEKGLNALREESKVVAELMKEFTIAPEEAHAWETIKHEAREDLGDFRQGKVTGYEFSRRFTFRMKDLDLCQKLARKLLEMKNVWDVRTSFDVTSRKQKEDELMQLAIADARARAERIAKGAGVRLADVYALSEADLTSLDSYFLRPPMTQGGTKSGGASALASTGGADEIIGAISRPPTIKLNASIRVIYRIVRGRGS